MLWIRRHGLRRPIAKGFLLRGRDSFVSAWRPTKQSRSAGTWAAADSRVEGAPISREAPDRTSGAILFPTRQPPSDA